MMIKIVPFQEKFAEDFKKLNTAWLEKFFVVEPYDAEVLSQPEKYIVNKGGSIYFVLENEIPKGTVALMYNELNELEFTKMAVDDSAQGKGYGNLLMQHCIDEAKAKGASELFLYSNTLLVPAISLYRKFGFEEIPVGKSEYKRCNIKMLKKLV